MTALLQQLLTGLSAGAIYALVALGYSMVYGVLRLINFAHGEVYMIGAMSGFYYYTKLAPAALHTHPFLQLLIALLFAMTCSALLGLVIEQLAYKPLRKAPRVSALITAIGVSLLLQYGGQVLFGSEPKQISPELLPFRSGFLWAGLSLNFAQLIILAASLVLMFCLRWLVFKTQLGRAMRAVAFSHAASGFVGIPVDRIITLTFVLGSCLAGAAGLLVSLANTSISPLMGGMLGLKAFVAAVLGGIGSIPGAVLGGLLMGIAETLVAAYWSSTYRDAIAFVLLIVVLLVKPTGLLGSTVKEKV